LALIELSAELGYTTRKSNFATELDIVIGLFVNRYAFGRTV